MQSKTSYFNKTIFLKTVGRFWPIWFVYALVWLVLLPLSVGSGIRYDTALNIRYTVLSSAQGGGVIICGIIAVLSAMGVWSFMYSSRSVSGMASLPLRRENAFCSVTLAGLLPLVTVNILVFLITLLVEATHGLLDMAALFQWLAIVTMQLLFFYGFATFCAQLTGNIIVLPIVYIILNFTFLVVEILVRSIGHKFVYGMHDYGNYILTPLSPPFQLLTRCGVNQNTAFVESTGRYIVTGYHFFGWLTLGLFTLAGLVFIALALLLYRRRRMETAGDVVAVRVLKPVFKYCLAFGCALCVGWLLYSITFETYVSAPGTLPQMLLMLLYMLFGAFIGYFAAEMLISKSFKVFKGRWVGIGVSAAVIIVLMFAAELDLFGFETRVPDAQDVKSVTLSYSGEFTEFDESENILAVTELHESIVQNKSLYEANYNSLDGQYVQILYKLKNGRQAARNYRLFFVDGQPDTYSDVLTLQELVNTNEAILQRKETAFEYTEDTLIGGGCQSWVYKDEYEAIEEKKFDDTDFSYFESGSYDYSYDSPSTEPVAVKAQDVLGEDDTGVYYNYDFTNEELLDLFYNCIVPDVEDGTLGRIWLITDEDYDETVYAAEISIDARKLVSEAWTNSSSTPEYNYDYFYTVPTVDSVRTNAWLEAHGVILHTRAELTAAG